MGLQGQGAFGSGYGSAATPNATTVPQGPTSIGQKAFGIVTGGDSPYPYAHIGFVSIGALALGLLAFIYWSLPR
jgi:hypothetical protein